MRDYDIESDLKQEKFQHLKLVQGDRGNKIKINVYEDGQPVNLTGCSITAKYKRADGQVIDGSVTNISNNSFDAVIDSDITKTSGVLKMLFAIEKDDVKVSTFMLLADVREGIGESTGSSGGSTGGGEVTVDLSNYYKKSETYSKSQIDSQFKDIAKRTIVENNKLYLVKADGTKLDEGTTLPTSSESVDLSNYVTKEDGKGLSTNDYTTAEKEKLAILENYNDTDIKEKINNKADKNEFYYNYKQAKAKNVVAIFLDDVTDDLYTNREKFKTRGIKITGGLRLDGVSDSGFSPSVSSDGGVSFPTTYAHIKELQDDYGIDFAYHGTKHGNNWGTTWSISEDINAFLESTSQHGIKIMGYIGPNGANLPDESKDKFLWRRNGMTGNTTAKPSMFFYPEDHINLDTIKTASIFESIKKSIDTLATKEGHVLALTGHVPTVINLDNFWSLIDYIISKGIDIITATEARMRYGYAIARLPEKTMIDDILDISGKGNYVLPNYFAMTESGVIKSNYCPVRWIDVSNINNANINNIENFEFGTTIVSSGSIDLMNGIPTVGTTFINRYGKNGEDFMIYRAYNDAGLFFRDVKTRQRWDKFAIVSTTVPTSPTATGYIGEMAVDTNYLYVCIASNSWIRIAKDSTWE